MDRNFELGGRKFQLNKIDAFKQFHIVRRIGPVLSELVPALKNNKPSEGLSEEEKLDMIAKVATPVMNGLSRLSDSDADLVLHGLLASVEVQQTSGNWMRISNSSMLMVQDLELPQLLQIAGRAFIFNLGNFFNALPVK